MDKKVSLEYPRPRYTTLGGTTRSGTPRRLRLCRCCSKVKGKENRSENHARPIRRPFVSAQLPTTTQEEGKTGKININASDLNFLSWWPLEVSCGES